MQDKKQSVDVYQMITDRFIEQLKRQIIPWKKSWYEAGLPQNLVTGKHFKGVNVWLLSMLDFKQNLFLSFSQLKEIGAVAKEGAKAAPVVYWKWNEVKDEEGGETKLVPFLRYYSVLNIEQCEHIPGEYIQGPPVNIVDPNNNCEVVIADMPQKPDIRNKEKKAYYNPLTDVLNMPKMENFKSSEDYYGMFFHQLAHSTGHHTRLNRRDFLQMSEFGSEQNSIEELVTSMASSYLRSWCGFSGKKGEKEPEMSELWLTKLKSDKRLIISASVYAQKAVESILNLRTEDVKETATSEEGKGDLPF